jgi:hypothetical protein
MATHRFSPYLRLNASGFFPRGGGLHEGTGGRTCGQKLGRRDDLADVALGVVGAMDEQAADGRGKGFAANTAGLGEVGCREGADAARGLVEPVVKLGDQAGLRGFWIEFRLQRVELDGAELVPFRIGEQAVETARYVTQMESDGGDAGGAGVAGRIGEGHAGCVDVVASQIERVDDGAENSREIGVRAAEPGFHDRFQITGSGARLRSRSDGVRG